MRTKFPKEVTTPVVCRDGDDFVKFMASFVMIHSAESGMPHEVFASGLKHLLHEYLALSLQGELEPYRASPDKKTTELFRDGMLTLAEKMMPNVPMKEEGGRVKIDVDAVFKKQGENPINSLIRRKDGKS